MNPSPLHRPSERGAIAIEFAISAIILSIIVFGCIGVALAFYTYEVVNQYARDASRYAMVHGSNCNSQTTGSSCSIGTGSTANSDLKSYLNNEIYPGINGNNLQITTTYGPGPGASSCNGPGGVCNGPGDQVTVQVSYQYLYNIPFIPQRLINMQGTSSMVISQ